MKESSLTSAKWWARAACQAKESAHVAMVYHGDCAQLHSAERAYHVAKNHMWQEIEKLTLRQRKYFDKYVAEQLRVFGLTAI